MFRPKLCAALQFKHIDLKERGSIIRDEGNDESLFVITVNNSFKRT